MPVITVSRMFGSGGSELAGRVAGALGWALLDNAIIDEVAARLGVSPEEVEAHEERVPSLAERLADALALATPEVMPPATDAPPIAPSEERMLETTARIIREAVARGPVVLVGRGAQSMLASRADALHVFCYAPRAALAARVARRQGLSEAEALRLVDETNRGRQQWVKLHFRRDWLAHENYHLCLNTDWLGVDGAAALVVRVARERLRGAPA